jgi:hypothetical protein
MPRLRQQHWFCLAAVCLAGTLVIIWSPDVRVAGQTSRETAESQLIRRASHIPRDIPAIQKMSVRSEIPHFPEILSAPNRSPRIDVSDQLHGREPMIAVPIPVSAGELNSASVLVPATHQRSSRSQVPASVWLEGRIEPVDTRK